MGSMAEMSFDRPGFSFDDLDELEGERDFQVREDAGGRGPLILALAGGVLVVFGAVVWNTYSQGVRTSEGELPVLLAEKSEYKTKGPGAQVAPDEPRRVYRQIETLPEEAVVPARANVAVAPAERDVRLAGEPPMDLRPGSDPEPEAAAPPVAGDETAAVVDPAPAEIGNAAPKAADETTLAEAPSIRTRRLERAPDIAVEPAPAASEPAAPRFSFSSEGNYLVQVAALRSEAGAEAAWSKLSVQYDDIFNGASRYVQRADLGAKGVFFRLRAGRFQDRSEAVSFCDALKADGGSCIVVER